MASLGGSFYSNDIADYYLTPYDLGYGPFVKFDHDFIGREALEKMAGKPAAQEGDAGLERRGCRQGVRLAVQRRARSRKYIDLPLANYATLPYDKVLKGGKTVGVSTYTGYTLQRARDGVAGHGRRRSTASRAREVTVVWGEEGGGSSKPTVERHAQAEIRATVAPVPISDVARVGYRPK